MALPKVSTPLLRPKVYAQISGIAIAGIALLGIVASIVAGSANDGKAGVLCGSGNMVCQGETSDSAFLAFDWVHNIVHVVLAGVAIAVGFFALSRFSTYYALGFGGVYTALGVLGFIMGDLKFLHLELGENIVHLLIGVWGVTSGLLGAPATTATPAATQTTPPNA